MFDNSLIRESKGKDGIAFPADAASAHNNGTSFGVDGDPKYMAEFFAKNEVTICVTDIGLGGMSVLSAIECLTRSQSSTLR